MSSSQRRFYDQAFRWQDYSPEQVPGEHAFGVSLGTFVSDHGLAEKRCLEVGSGRGAFQYLVRHYVGIDITSSVGACHTVPFVVACATGLPFRSESFDAVWSVTVLEHVGGPELALAEMWRVLGPGGYLFLAPAWQCRSWAAEGYPVRSYAELSWRGKIMKASIPLRNSLPVRAMMLLPRRLARLLVYMATREPTSFRYRELDANFEKYWMSDSDAINSMDPFEAYMWYASRGASCLNYPSLADAFLVRTGPLIFQKPLPG